MPDHLLEAHRLGAPGLAVMFVNVVPVAHYWPGIPDKLPPDEVRIAAVHGVREHAFDGVGAQHPEKNRCFDGPQPLVLFLRLQIGKVSKLPRALAVDLLRG